MQRLLFPVLCGSLLAAFACGPETNAVPMPITPAPTTSSVASAAKAASAPAAPVVKNEDFLFLEEVTGEKALAFARAHNGVSEKTLTSDPGFAALQERLTSIYASKERIPSPSIQNDGVRNFWTDSTNPRGLWRQTTLAEYKKPKPAWTTLLDVDALGKTENESFVWHGAACFYPARKKCLVSLSKGGGDAAIVREFDVDTKSFVKGGFVLPEAKSRISWKDENTVFVATDFGAGSLTKAGYPRLVKEWKRGTPLTAATQIFEVRDTDISGSCSRDFDHERKRDFCVRSIDFEHSELFWRKDEKLVHIDKPDDADGDIWDDELLLRLRSDWIAAPPRSPTRRAASSRSTWKAS